MMTEMMTILTMILCTSLIILTHSLAPADSVVNVIASFILTIVITSMLPGMENLPTIGYPVAWIMFFIGLQFLMPLGSGQTIVRHYPRATAVQFGRVMVGVAVV